MWLRRTHLLQKEMTPLWRRRAFVAKEDAEDGKPLQEDAAAAQASGTISKQALISGCLFGIMVGHDYREMCVNKSAVWAFEQGWL